MLSGHGEEESLSALQQKMPRLLVRFPRAALVRGHTGSGFQQPEVHGSEDSSVGVMCGGVIYTHPAGG